MVLIYKGAKSMRVDPSRFPLVWLDSSPANAEPTDKVLDDMSALLARQQPFVFLAAGGFDDAEPDLDARRKVASWMKANKPAIVRYIKAQLHVADTVEARDKALEFGRIFENFWGYPLLVVGSCDEAETRARALLG